MELLTSVLGVITGFLIMILYYYHLKRKWHFAVEGIPYVNPTFLVGSIGPVILNTRSAAEQGKIIYDSYPTAKYVGFYELTNPVIMIRDLELIKSMTVKYFEHFRNHISSWDEELDPLFAKSVFFLRDDAWKNTRSILTRFFTSSRMKNMFELVSNCANEFSNHIATLSQNNPLELEMKDTLTRYGNDAIIRVLFGINVNSMKDKTNEFYIMGKGTTKIDHIAGIKMFLYRICPTLSRIFKLNIFNRKATKYFYNIVADATNARESNNIINNDIIQLMLEARDNGNVQFQHIDDITANAFIFFFGGFDTSTITMSFAVYEIAQNQNIQDRLRAEIDTALEECNGKINYDIIRNMKYLDAVVNETLRKYPPASQADRICTKSFELPPALPNLPPYTVHPGTMFSIPIYSFHHDPQYHHDPEIFDPERFLNINKEPPGFLPFGSGPRHCIAQRLAIMLVKAMLFHLLSQCKLIPSPKTPFIILYNTLFVMESKNGMWLRIIPRD